MSLLAQLEIPTVEWIGLLPLLIVGGSAVLMLTIASVIGRFVPAWFWSVLTTAVGIAGFIATVVVWYDLDDRDGYATLADAVIIDRFGLFLTGLICATVVLAAMLGHDYLQREKLDDLEFYVLLLLSASGGIIMTGAHDLIVMFLGIEILSIAVYVLAAMHLGRVQSQEAGMKYFVLGAFASAFLLYGIALIYGATGSTNLGKAGQYAASLDDNGLLMGGFAFLLVGLGFKIAAVPFHSWTPDVYQGAPSPVVAYMASGVKVAGFAAILRIFNVSFKWGTLPDDWRPILTGLAVASMVVGSVLAVVQTDVKRMLAYSSISHAGFILLGVQAATQIGLEASLFYLAAYAFVVSGSFAVVTIAGHDGDAAHQLSDYDGLAKRRPAVALIFTILLFAQAGVPFTSGFFGKFYVIGATIDRGDYWLAIIAMLSAVVAAFLYLRIVLSMYGDGDDAVDAVEVPFPIGAKITLAITVGFTLFFGIFPDQLVDVARDALPTTTLPF